MINPEAEFAARYFQFPRRAVRRNFIILSDDIFYAAASISYCQDECISEWLKRSCDPAFPGQSVYPLRRREDGLRKNVSKCAGLCFYLSRLFSLCF